MDGASGFKLRQTSVHQCHSLLNGQSPRHQHTGSIPKLMILPLDRTWTSEIGHSEATLSLA